MARRLGLALVLLPVLALLIIVLGLALAQTATGKRLLAERVGELLSSPGSRVELAGLEGLVPFGMRLGRLTIADPDGTWLEATDARLSWAPVALLRGRVQVSDLSVREVDLQRLPSAPPAEEPEELPRLPELPGWLPPVTVERLALERLNLGEPVLGEPASFALEGRLATVDDGGAALLDLEARRVDEATATASVQAKLGLEPASLDLSIAADETGGLLALITGRPSAGDLQVWLSGAGPLEAWQGRLTVDAEGLLRADATVALEQLSRFRIAGRVEPAQDLLPPDLAPLAGPRIDLALNGSRPAAQRLDIEQLSVHAAAAELHGRGTIDFDEQRIDLQSDLTAADLSAFSALSGQPLAGHAELTLTAEGALMRPAGRLGLAARDLAFAEVSARSATADLEYTVLEPLDSPELAARVGGQGQVDDLTLPVSSPLSPRDVGWRLGMLARASGPVDVQELAIESDPLRLTGEGRIDPRTLAGTAALVLEASDLGQITEAFGQRVDGRLRLDATTTIAEQAERIDVELTGGPENLTGLPDAVAPLLGPAPKLSATARIEPDRRIEVSSLEVTGAAANLDGQVAMSLPDQALDGRIRLRLPRLAALGQVIRQDLAGAIEAVATLGGKVGSPEVALQAGGQDLVLAGREFQRLALAATGKNLITAPEGSLELTTAVAGIEAALSSGYRLEDQRLRLSDLGLTGPRAKLGGEATIDLSGLLINGRLNGRIEDLAAWRPLLPIPLGGRLDLDAQLQARNGQQAVVLSADLGDLLSDLAQVQRIGLRANIEDALGTPRLDATLTAAGLRRDDLVVSSARLGARGRLDALRLTAAADGKAIEDFDLAAEAGLTLGDAVALRLERLNGHVAGETLRLAAPAELRIAGDDLRLTGLDLRLGRAALRGNVALGSREVQGEVRLAQLPLALLGRFGAPELDGSADATLRLSGAADNPRGEVRLVLADVKLADPDLDEVPPVRLTADAVLADRRLNGTVQAEGASDQPLTASFGLPLVVRFQPAMLELPQDGAISGRLDGRLRLARLSDLLLDDQSLDGLLTAALTVDGTIAQPRAGGSLELSGGSYANGTSGTVLRDLHLVARASGRRLAIQKLSATDGSRGRIEGQGEIGFEDGVQADLRVQLKQAHLVRLDEADAALSGDLRLQGTASQARLSGQVTVDRAEVRIHDSAGPNIAVIEVQEIGANGEARPSPEPPAEPFVLRLDAGVSIPGQLFVRGRGLESEWQGKLKVAGTATEPSIVGELRVRRGFFDFIGRRFQLTESTIEFTGATPPDPILGIHATATTADLTAIIRVTGPASAPEFAFESQPPLPRDEVLSRLLFNRPVSQIGPVEAAQLAFAVNRLRGGGGLGVLGEIRRGLGVDTLDVVTGDGPDGGATVRAGRYLSDDVYLELEQGTGQQTGRARVEIEILPNVSVEADTGADARSGIGLRWRLDY